MKVRWSLFPGQVFEAVLSRVPSQVSQTGEDIVLEIQVSMPGMAGMAPTVLHTGSAAGVQIVEATDLELKNLQEAGFDLTL